jgi:hypothetical protein
MSGADVPSPVLYHGPTAQGRSAEAASAWGRVLGSFGHPRDGLNIEAVREAVSVMAAPPVGDVRGSVVVGPIDVLTLEGVADVFLKTLEERNPRGPRPFLWAWDLGSVRPTIQSRCLVEWCPGTVRYDKTTTEAARAAVDASLARSTAGVIEAFDEVRKGWKDDGDDFLRAAVQVLAGRTEPNRLQLWASIRPLFMSGAVTCDEALAGFLL